MKLFNGLQVAATTLWITELLFCFSCDHVSDAFSFSPISNFRQIHSTTSTALRSSSSSVDARRRTLLSRRGPHFDLNRRTGQIEFGATARLTTQLLTETTIDDEMTIQKDIDAWLQEEDSFATSIWRKDLMQDLGNNVYRLQVLELNFVSLQLAPWVDLRMKTVSDKNGNPVFTLQSVGFEPNVKLGKNMQISAQQLGIVIEVAGQLRRGKEGASVSGSIAFQTTGNLPPPLRILPNGVLQAASDSINDTIVQFAIQSFESGARENFQQYLAQSKQQETTASSN